MNRARFVVIGQMLDLGAFFLGGLATEEEVAAVAEAESKAARCDVVTAYDVDEQMQRVWSDGGWGEWEPWQVELP